MEKEGFYIRTDKLEDLYNIGKKVSLILSDVCPTTLRAAQAEKISEKVLLHCNSIIKLFDMAQEDYSELDIALIASAARNIMDSGNVYFYVTERGISEEEVQFRYNLQIVNYEKNVKDIFRKLKFLMDSYKMRLLDHDFVIKEIKETSIYSEADENEKKRILSGKPFFRRKSTGIFSLETESAIFNILSNSIHSFYIGLSNNSINRSLVFNSYIDPVMLCIISVETAMIYTANILYDYLQLRKQLGRTLAREEREQIKALRSTEFLEAYLKEQRDRFGRGFLQVNRNIQ